ncbi:MAG: amino acid permease [Bacteroidetes bacterium]|nr:amino acid permease [Bacteroidota bacterium]
MSFQQLFRKKSVEQIMRNADIDAEASGGKLHKTLGVRDLTAFGIAAIIGAGIFSTIGKASYLGGPGVILLFIFTAVACSFAALAYAEFASLVPVSGSAYTYSYVAFGELFAWIIGWALIMEYAIGNITVAISWSDYFTSLFNSINFHGHHWHMPEWMTMDYFTAHNGFNNISKMLSSGSKLNVLAGSQDFGGEVSKYLAWKNAPAIGSFHFVLDIPALSIIVLITWLVYRGMKESRNASNIMVGIKLVVVIMVIVFGSFYIDTNNWHPFLPHGVGGLLGGISAVFFAYIGFDAISTTAEECKNPQRDLPRGILYSIVICTVLYVIIALVITGMMSYKELNVGDPLAHVFEKFAQLKWLKNIIAVSAVVAMASVLLVFQLGQPRIWLTMSRDGLLPKRFSKIHPRFRTPSFATIMTGLMVGIPAFFLDLSFVTDVCSLGTLFAFVLVCAGVLRLDADPNAPRGKFRLPYVSARYIVPVLAVALTVVCVKFSPDSTKEFFRSQKVFDSDTLLKMTTPAQTLSIRNKLIALAASKPDAFDSATVAKVKNNSDSVATTDLAAAVNNGEYVRIVRASVDDDKIKYESGFNVFFHNIPMWVFLLVALFIVYRSISRKLSLIPVLGLLCCLYMMSELGWKNWLWFTGWLIIGLVIYFTYSRKNSRLAQTSNS